MDCDTRERKKVGEPIVLRDEERVPWVQSPQSVCAAESGSLSRSVSSISTMTYAISSGLACFADAAVEMAVSAQEGPGLADTNIGLPISHKSCLVHVEQSPVERLRIRCPVEILVPWW